MIMECFLSFSCSSLFEATQSDLGTVNGSRKHPLLCIRCWNESAVNSHVLGIVNWLKLDCYHAIERSAYLTPDYLAEENY